MNALPRALESPEVSSSWPQDLPQKPLKDHRRELLTAPKSIWKTTGHPSPRDAAQAFFLVPARHGTKALPKSPVPSMASSDEELEDDKGKIESAGIEVSQAEDNAAQEERGNHKMFLNDADADGRELDELVKMRESIAPVLSESNENLSDFHQNASNVLSRNTDFSFDRVTNQSGLWKRASSASGSGSGSSTDLSQLRCSSFSLDSVACSDCELETNNSSSKISDRIQLHNGSPLVASSLYSSIVDANPSLSGCYSISDPLQASPSAEKLSPPKEPPSFLEIWHDQVLNHCNWSLCYLCCFLQVPPPSEKKDTDLLEAREQISKACAAWYLPCLPTSTDALYEESYDDLRAHKELDGIIPSTGLLSHQLLDKSSKLSNSELTESSPASHILRTTHPERSLAEIGLSLMDRQGSASAIGQVDQHLAERSLADSLEKISGRDAGEMDRIMKNNGFPPHHTELVSANTPMVTCFDNEKEEPPRFVRMDIDLNPSMLLVKDIKQSSMLQPDHTKDSGQFSASSPSCTNEEDSPLLPNNPNDSEPGWASEDVHRMKRTWSQDESDGGVDIGLQSSKDTAENEAIWSVSSCHAESEKILESPQTSQIDRQASSKVEHSLLEKMGRARQAEERKTKALTILKKLSEAKAPGVRVKEAMNISSFEDFDFLAKYCIFNQEKLALYKRTFEAVDGDKDGYLTCLEVLMALKEIVPAGELTDAEEIYIYRILEITDYHVTDGLTDFRLFAVIASLAQKIAALDDFMRSLIGNMDFKALELRMYKARQLFLCNVDSEESSISVQQLLVELKAGGISEIHEESVRKKLWNMKALDLLDFLTYLPLFVLIHNSILLNPLDNSRTI
ncbi:uncharacterized protein LOC103179917 [Callorhinchus milii]|uniref:uncharacterized protein LOC103179917 n=1 Tax=Callorhinchus milii TaxID=7868 RepID=UPI001C3FE8C5|nr:uncharacterized protein LOC103179917 [Callorhinchus milii]